MNPAFSEIEHRPYPINPRPWLMQQTWMDLAFIHWRVDVEKIRPHVPATLEIETFDGSAWIGVVPFRMTAGPRGVPVPVSEFPELNVRTYARCGDKSGVYFFSLDCANPVAVWGARTFLQLPYFNAKMRLTHGRDWTFFDSRRTDPRGQAVEFRANYRPTGEEFRPTPGSLEYFLTERYCLLLEDDGSPHCIDIQHPRWDLQPAEVQITRNTMLDFLQTDFSNQKPSVLFAKNQFAVAWLIEDLGDK